MTAKKATHKTKFQPLASQASPVESTENISFPVVGIGASAGGLSAFEEFFSGMTDCDDPGMAFVLVQHLAPDHKSMLSELIRRFTRMQVFEVEDGMVIQPNCVYVIPPNRNMALLNGTLQLLEPIAPHGHRMPIDFFFRSLAQDLRERAICIVLTGTGSDGTLGVRAIKSAGGMAIAQSPDSAEYDSMPLSAVATGLVDYELAPHEMFVQLMAYAAHAFAHLTRFAPVLAPKAGSALKKILILVRTQTGHDFSKYKSSTIMRRIDRRMAVHQIESMENYVKYLQQTSAEIAALFSDLLIGVTRFFRDPEAFRALEEQVIPALFAGKPAGSVIRVWSAGCSSGEEAYSIAILLLEHMEVLKLNYTFQIFATDIDSHAIAKARAGLYPSSIAADLTPERLARFFTQEIGYSAYRIHKGIRNMLIFSEQDVIKDSPFSKLDLISCRNLLIYLGTELQQKLISLFHYALNPGGMLFLGTSESVGEINSVFGVLNRKAKLYQRKEDIHSQRRASLSLLLSPMMERNAALPRVVEKTILPVKLPLRELTEQALLQQIAPAGALVNARGDILYLYGRTGMYLELVPGEAGVNNIIKMAREGLQRELTTALHKASVSKEIVRAQCLSIKTNGHLTTANLTIRPVLLCPELMEGVSTDATHKAQLYLVILEEALPVDAKLAHQADLHAIAIADDPATQSDFRILALSHELQVKEEYLQTIKEELDTANEMLKSSSEGMLSANEELQSTNEELETSKEELQSLNEELITVNAELQIKVTDLSQANNDMNNLLGGTGVGTVFVDHQLRILRFTPEARLIINLITGDEGRPVAHIVSNLVGYDHLVTDVQAVLDTLVPKQVDVQTTAFKWYTMRILPYRTLDNVIEGAVITFVDITEMIQIREALFKAGALQRAIFNSENFSSIATDAKGVIQIFNVGAERMLGFAALDVMNKITPADISDPQELIARAEALSIELGTKIAPGFEALVFKASRGIEDIYELTYIRRDGSRFPAVVSVTALRDTQDAIIGYLIIGTDNTARKRAEAALQKAGALQKAIFDSENFSSIATDAKGVIQIFNVGAERMLGYAAADVMNKITPADLSDPQELIARARALSEEFGIPIEPGFEALVFKASRGIEDIYELTYIRCDGSRFPAVVSVTALRDAQDAIIGYLIIGTDNTARKQAEEALQKAGALQKAIFDSENFSSIATDAKGVIQIFNVGAERMLGYAAADVMNKITPADLSDPQELIARARALSEEFGIPIEPGFEALVFKASRGIEDIYELTKIRRDGSRFPAVVSVTALRDAQDAIIGYLIIGTDNTARKQAEEALQKANEVLRLAVVVRDTHDAITVQDLSGRILAWNPGAVRMYGWSEAEALLMNVRERIPPALRESALSKMLQLSQTEILEPYLTQRITKNGVVVEVSLTSTALLNEAGEIYSTLITERMRASKTDPDKEVH